MRILLDLDGIIADLPSAWYAAYNDEYGDDLSVEKVAGWDPTPFTKRKDPAALFGILAQPGFYRMLQPLPGAVEGVARLYDLGHELVVVGAVPRNAPGAYGDKAWWVAKHLPMVHRDNVVFTASKHVVKGDLLFDDGPHNLLDYHAAWPEAYLATIRYPYNGEAIARLLPEHPGFFLAGHYHNVEAAWRSFTSWVQGLDVAEFQRAFARAGVAR